MVYIKNSTHDDTPLLYFFLFLKPYRWLLYLSLFFFSLGGITVHIERILSMDSQAWAFSMRIIITTMMELEFDLGRHFF